MASLPEPDAANVDAAYEAYCKVLLGAAKKKHPTRLQQELHPWLGRGVQPPPKRPPEG